MAIYSYISPGGDGFQNLAMDGFFLENLKPEDIVLYLFVNRCAVIIGKGQNAWRECNLDAMEKDGVQLVRRHTGGGAVYHDDQNLNFSFIMGEKHYDLEKQMRVIQRAASSFGIRAELSGRNDILAEGRKFSGNAFALSKGIRAHHGTLLIGTDLSRLARYLNVSQKKMRAKGIESVRSRVCNLSDLNRDVTVPAMEKALLREFEAEYGAFVEYPFRKEEQKRIEEMREIQASWEWRFGKTPAFDYKIEQRYSFGEMQFLFQVKEGAVRDLFVYTDALDLSLAPLLKESLVGARFDPSFLAEKLRRDPVHPAFEEIARDLEQSTF